MLLGGLWHGANWTFVIWGALHGLYLGAERVLGWHRIEPGSDARWVRGLKWLLTFHLVCLAWVFFRARSASHAFDLLGQLTTPEVDTVGLTVLPVLAILLVYQSVIKPRWSPVEFLRTRPISARWVCYAAALILGIIYAGSPSPDFIYFQF